MAGDVDIAATAAILGDPARARMLAALADGRALPASVLANEAGVAPSTASGHLARLMRGGLVRDERHGRHRYFRLAGPAVADMLEAIARVAPAAPVRSLRDGAKATALRTARTCYDHLAGRLGTSLFAAMLEEGLLDGGDGTFDPDLAARDRLSAPGWDVDYRLTDRGVGRMEALGIDVRRLSARRRPVVRYCIDWSEQRHHLAGGLGAAVCQRAHDLGWVRRAPGSRAVFMTADGAAGFERAFGLRSDPAWVRG
jgi:DNA-binding transcriptional ArsR family regulator